jgi:hypothetical protein
MVGKLIEGIHSLFATTFIRIISMLFPNIGMEYILLSVVKHFMNQSYIRCTTLFLPQCQSFGMQFSILNTTKRDF